uniref:ZP domain-containing protein n=1 Tax=Anabas testudineus TaxID=64144 RepID=A0A3Q1IRN5_ANATE
MLPLFLYLCALSLLTGSQSFNISSEELDISSCPITFFGQKYDHLYVNSTNENFVVCFDGFYDPDGTGDCFVGQQSMNGQSEFSIHPGDAKSEATILQDLPTIRSKQQCTVNFMFQTSGLDVSVSVNQPGVGAHLVMFSIEVNGDRVETLNVTNTPESQQLSDTVDLSACRHSGVLFNPGTLVSSDPNTCTNLTCDQTAVLISTGCGPSERCQGNNTCLEDTIITCTVTGPSVIDFHSQVTFIEDRCAYSLLSTPLVPDFLLLANFQERRRKDVSFLDSVTLLLGSAGAQIHLEQGGRVLLDDTLLTLNLSAQMVHGVELSEDRKGVTANFSLSNYTASVFFDGYTVQVHLQGPGAEDLSLQGLCYNSNDSLSDSRLLDHSDSGCQIQYNDTPDSTINCTVATEHCNLLKEAPFSSCNSVIDPEPYITACIDTMCKYPAVDELNCQFLEAYDRACSLQHISVADGWRSNTGCSHEAFCHRQTCLSNEFCAARFVGGTAGCFCRAIFASKYTSTGAWVCGPDSASLTLVGCLLVENGIDYSALHLNDPMCRGQMNEQTHMVTFSFNNSHSCGTEVLANGSQIIYENTIVTQNVSNDMITRQDKVRIDFSCVHTQPDVQTMSFRIRDRCVATFVTSEFWKYNVTMQAYTEPTLTQVLTSDTEVQLDQRIWVELETEGLEGSFVSVVTDSCWATNEPSANESLRYDLIVNGCPNPDDNTVRVHHNGEGTSNYFSFNMFQFAGTPGDIYLHCKLELCITEHNHCAVDCDHDERKKRAVRPPYEGDATALISMAWVN